MSSVSYPMTVLAHDYPQRAACLTYRRCLFVLLIVGIAARLLRFFLVFPIWGDEAFICLNLLERDYTELAGPLRFDQVAPILFLWLEKSMYHLLGTSEIALRLPSLLAGAAALFVFVLFARSILARRSALIAIGIFCVSYYPVRHAVEIKPYALDLFAATTLLAIAAAWLRFPHRRTLMVLLVVVTPFALAASYPAVFVAGGISISLLQPMQRQQDLTTRRLFVLYNVLLLSTFAILYSLVGKQQHEGMVGSSTGYWDASFPPASILEWPGWLLSIHTGNLFAYPSGGRNGASVLTFLCCLLGIRLLWRTGRRTQLLLLTMPFALTLLAAILHKYPYGGSARVSQHLAPSICLLAGLGLSSILRRHLLVIALVLLGVGGMVRDVVSPFKTPGDEQARRLIRQLSDEVGPEDVLVVWDAPQRLYPTLEWYLRVQGKRLCWTADPAAIPQLDQDKRVWCLCFQTNAGPATTPPPGFTLTRHATISLELGTEPDATRSCVVWRLSPRDTLTAHGFGSSGLTDGGP